MHTNIMSQTGGERRAAEPQRMRETNRLELPFGIIIFFGTSLVPNLFF